MCGLVALIRGARGALAAVLFGGILAAGSPALAGSSWNFVVSGDSRNCGDVVMPSIAAGARAHDAVFYWHLGDLRAIHDIDEDFRALHPKASFNEYLAGAWIDFERNQIEAFGAMPFFLGMGNHESVLPKTREEFLVTFADWLNAPPIRDRRLEDDPHDHTLRAYYHWMRDGVDFISLDNATPDQFDVAQLAWLRQVLENDRRDGAVRALVVGMHEALPESISRGHSMSEGINMEMTGFTVYEELLEMRKSKPVYVLASHSHFVMEDVFNTPYWHDHGGVLPGWIVGTAGAVRYALPPEASRAKFAKTRVYGYLLATVSPPGAGEKDPIRFAFHEVTEAEVPAAVAQRFGPELLQFCYHENARD